MTTTACEPKVWKVLTGLANARKVAKARESELVGTRKDLDNQLDALGAGDSQQHLKVSRDYVVTIRSIDFERDRLKKLADDMEAAIENAIQGKFEFVEEFNEKQAVKRPKEADLFTPPPPPAPPKPKDERPVGKPRKPSAEPALPEGELQHLAASVNELDITEKKKGQIIKAGIFTIGQLAQLVDTDTTESALLATALDVESHIARQIATALHKFRKAHRKAEVEVERVS